MRASILADLLFLVLPVGAQSVVRGPYLQSPTHSGITVMWRTNVACNTRLWVGTDPSSLVQVASSGTLTTEHRATVGGLAPGTLYYYAVGANTALIAGGTGSHRFRTLPQPGSDVPVRVWALGDFGKGNADQVAVKQAYTSAGEEADVWIWLGDNVYDDGKDSEYQAKLFALQGFKDIFSNLPFYPAPGNHDYNEVWGESTFFGIPYSNIALEDHDGPYYDMVHVPTQGEAGGQASGLELYYSFDLGNAHFVSLNSEVYDFLGTYNGIDRMLDWLQLDLQQNIRRFTIAYFHQPPYSKGSHDSDDWTEAVMRAMRERVVPVLESFDVDLVICGHSHVYERSHLIHGHYGSSASFNEATMLRDGNGGNFDAGTPYVKDTLDVTPDGTVYVVCGNGGASEAEPPLNHPVMFASEGGNGVCGSFLIDIAGDRLGGTYLRKDGSIGDQFTILKGASVPIAVAERTGSTTMHVFPNPAQGTLNVRLERAPTDGVLRLVDGTGRVILSRTIDHDRLVIDLHGVAMGSYQLLLMATEARACVAVMVE